jgi:predicted ribosome quality control (RQC) complex YloA/Tae2 family protein
MYEAYENPHPPSVSTMTQPLHTMPSVSTMTQDRISQETNSSRAYRRASRISEKESLEAEIKRTVRDLREKLDEEKRRAERAERKVEEVTAHLKAVNEARLVALREASQAKEELRCVATDSCTSRPVVH